VTLPARSSDTCRVALVRPEAGICAPEESLQLERLARALGVPLLPAGVVPGREARCDIYLSLDAIGPYLQLTGRQAPGPVRCSFDEPGMAHRRRGGHNELLGRAIGVGRFPRCRVVDCTAGFAGDGFVLADLGARVLLCEQHPLIAAFLDMSLARLRAAAGDWRQEVSRRMSVRAGDSRSLPAAQLETMDVLYLDPMFPLERRSAAGKGMMLLQRLLSQGPSDSGESLLRWALDQRVWRVVVKRPLKAPPLGSVRPSHLLTGRSVRFDVYQIGGGIDDAS